MTLNEKEHLIVQNRSIAHKIQGNIEINSVFHLFYDTDLSIGYSIQVYVLLSIHDSKVKEDFDVDFQDLKRILQLECVNDLLQYIMPMYHLYKIFINSNKIHT